jgi:hypothetical protein
MWLFRAVIVLVILAPLTWWEVSHFFLLCLSFQSHGLYLCPASSHLLTINTHTHTTLLSGFTVPRFSGDSHLYQRSVPALHTSLTSLTAFTGFPCWKETQNPEWGIQTDLDLFPLQPPTLPLLAHLLLANWLVTASKASKALPTSKPLLILVLLQLVVPSCPLAASLSPSLPLNVPPTSRVLCQ